MKDEEDEAWDRNEEYDNDNERARRDFVAFMTGERSSAGNVR